MSKPITANDHSKLHPAINLNLTHIAKIRNLKFKSVIPELMTSIVDAHKEYVGKLEADQTKTDTMKELMVRRDANKRISEITKSIDSVYQATISQLTELENIVSQQWKIKGTTDFLILQNQASVLQNMKFSDVVGLVQSGDVSTLRSLQLPVMQHLFKLNEPQRKEQLSQLKESQLLSKQQHDLLVQSRGATEALATMGEGLVKQVGSNIEAINQIQSTIVEVA